MKTLLLSTLLSITLLSTITQAADEGIKVHGHWKFEIYNPDGSFDRKVEFENSLRPKGSEYLLKLIYGKALFDNYWSIHVDTLGVSPCLDNGNGSSCIINPPGGADSSYQFYNLTYLPDNMNTPTKLVLKGSMIVNNPSSVNISKVTTYIRICTNDSTLPLVDCTGSGDNQVEAEFTGTELSTPVPITFGQQVQITVEISFS